MTLSCICSTAFADNEADFNKELGIGDVYAYAPDDAKIISGELVTDGSYDYKGAIERLIKKLTDTAKESIINSLSQFTEILSIALLCAVCCSFYPNEKVSRFIPMAACCVCIIISLQTVNGVISYIETAIDNIKMYSNIALPSLFVSSAASGNVISGPAKFAAVSLSMDVITTSAADICKPMVKAYLALGLSSKLSDNTLMESITKFAKWSTVTILSALMIAFTTYINFVGIISSSADAAAVKAAKTVISTTLPIVGGIISDAAATVLSSASLIKASGGVFTLVCAASICLIPFVSCGVKMLIFKVVSAVSDGLGVPKVAGTLNCIGTAIGLYCAILGSCGIMFFISISSALKAFTG